MSMCVPIAVPTRQVFKNDRLTSRKQDLTSIPVGNNLDRIASHCERVTFVHMEYLRGPQTYAYL